MFMLLFDHWFKSNGLTSNGHMLLVDLRMPEVDGLELTNFVRAQHPEVPVVLLMSEGSDARRAGYSSFPAERRLRQMTAPSRP